MSYITSDGTFAAGTSGNDIIEATSDHDCLYGGAGSDTFLLSADVLKDYNTVASEGYSMLGIADFHSGGTPSGLGEQDFLAFRGFSHDATLNVAWENPLDSSGGRYIQYDISDDGKHYDFMLYSVNGNTLTAGLDYAFYYSSSPTAA